MTVVALDTHEIVKELKAAGFNEAQAEAVTRVVRRAQDLDLSHLATKTDLDALRIATKTDLDALRIATKTDLDGLRTATKTDLDALRIATKADIDSLRVATRADFEALKATTNTALAETKADIVKWMFGTIGFQTLVIVGAIIALTRAIVP